jgi:homoserine kinase type II
VIRHWPAAHGIENRNFFLAAVRGGTALEYVLTLMERPANAGEALVTLLDLCARRGLPVPTPLRTRNGSPILVVDGKHALLCPRLAGRHVLIPTTAQVASLGRFIARLHVGTTNAVELPAYPRDGEWLEQQARTALPRLPYLQQRLLRDALTDAQALLTRTDVAQLPAGVIHGDLFRDNVLFNHLGLSGVLDFHHAAHGYWIYDLAVAANDWCVDAQGALDQERLLALLSAYGSIRPLESAELWHLPLFLLYAGLAFWLSRLAVALERQQGRTDRGNDPEVFARIVAARRDAPAYVDPWRIDQNVAASER